MILNGWEFTLEDFGAFVQSCPKGGSKEHELGVKGWLLCKPSQVLGRDTPKQGAGHEKTGRTKRHF